MLQWIDLALLGDEARLSAAIDGLDESGRTAVIADLADQLGMNDAQIQRATLRILVERVRPFALSSALWSRPITSSDDPRAEIRRQFARRGVAETPERIDLALQLYAQFTQDRAKVPVREIDLMRCGYRCEHCGLAFCNEDLVSRGLISPFGLRGTDKTDPLKPHWNGPDNNRYPTMDHDWPVSLYGDNGINNLRVLCGACNQGKANYLALQQLKPWVGLPERAQLLGGSSLSFDVFYAQIRRSPSCFQSGRKADVTELTVALRDVHSAPVLDNLVTIESSGL
ncbi:HNH endonuclease [Mesorhizobium sanjuanii]|uniref:HNH endonuclease n=1 Tax=Mesorhizobium sanjuanii TaxID=2037900 RepID=UPI000E1D52A2|nr:HNH endonuclease domain-containing protein [Mesorhizobium sanjuanii]